MLLSDVILSLLGGAMIGLAVLVLLGFNGRVLGASGIWGGLIARSEGFGWRLAFVAGVIAAPILFRLAGRPVSIQVGTPEILILAGLLVGVGTALGSGCTSGHGICGISRMSPRSLVATAVFMGVGFATVFVVRHVMAG